MRIDVKVVPKSSRDRIVGWIGNRLKVSVTAPPERGKANRAVMDLLAQTLGVAPAGVRIVAGETSALKTVEVDAPDAAALLGRLPAR